MKRKLSLVLVTLLPMLACAYDAKINGIYYNFSGDEATVTYENYQSASYSGVVVIPKTVTYNGKTYRVTGIGDYAFYGCTELTSAICLFSDSLAYNKNLVENGDFSSGNEGFMSDYIYVNETGGWALQEEGQYAVGTSPSIYHRSFIDHGDHTTGTGNMLIVNGSPKNLDYVWKQNVIVDREKTYEFSAWYIKANKGENSFKEDIEYSINGTIIPGTYDKTENDWERYYGTYTATESGEIEIKIRTKSEVLLGNDFAIDDIYFSELYVYNANVSNETSIGNYAFYGCSNLTTIIIDSNVSSIGNCAFANCLKLTHFYCNSPLVPSIQNDTFEGLNIESVTLYVPVGSVDYYKMIPLWNNFGMVVPIGKAIKYQIGTASDLVTFASYVNACSHRVDAVLTNDIDMSGKEWFAPIGFWGSNEIAYKGHFNGQSHAITNLTYTTAQNYHGLFGVLTTGALVENFSISGTITNADYTEFGPIGSARDNNPIIRNVKSTMNINNTRVGARIGGILGAAYNGTPIVECCTYSGNLDSNDNAGGGNYGGIIGYINNNTNCVPVISNCLFDGTLVNTAVTPGGCTFGGIVGYVGVNPMVTIKNCLSIGTVQSAVAGQFFGIVKNTTCSILNSYYQGLYVNGNADGAVVLPTQETTKATDTQLASGEICYRLNGDQNEIYWYQTLGEDDFPVLDNSHLPVWFIEGFYVNPDYHFTITIDNTGYGTYCSKYPLDFSEVSGLNAYIASGFSPSTGKLVLTHVNEVPAGEGLLLVGEAGTYKVPFKETDMFYSNLLKGITTDTTLSQTDGRYSNFILSDGYHGIGFYNLFSAYELEAGKAYLQLPTSSVSGVKAISFIFEDDADTVQSIDEDSRTEGVYNLQGQQFCKPQKGINIIRLSDGTTRKVLMK